MKVVIPDLMKVEHNVRVLQEARSLQKAGYDVLMLGFSNKTKEKRLTINGINVISFYLGDVRNGFGKIFRYFSAIRMIVLINLFIIKTKADVYHAHNFHVLAACFFSAIIHKGKLIYDSHESWTIHRNKKYHPEHISAYIIEKLFLHRISGFLTVNEMVADFYKEKYHTKEAVILYNNRPLVPIVNKDLIRKELPIDRNKKIAIFVGGFWPSGRPLFEIIHSAKFIDEKVVIVLIGYGSDSLIHKMNETIFDTNTTGKVFILPPKPPDKVMDFVMSADIGLNLIKRVSKAQDFQSPWKLFEYCMGGLAVLSTDLPFHRKVCDKYEIGILCGVENSPRDIGESINQLISNEKDFCNYKMNARKAAELEFNWGVQEKKLLGLYHDFASN